MQTKLFFFLALGLLIACNAPVSSTEEAKEAVTVVKETPAKVVNEVVATSGYQVGDIAGDFKLKNIDGNMVSLSDFEEAKGFVIIFTCNHCPYAIAYEDRINELDASYKTKGYPVIAINPNDPTVVPEDGFEAMKVRAKEKSFSFPYLFDDKQEVYPVYGATRTPHIYVLQKTDKGNEVAYIGTIDDNYSDASAVKVKYLEDALDALLKGEKPSPAVTKAIGCSIKVKS